MSVITFEHSFFRYPQHLKDLISEGIVDFGVWYLMNDEQTTRRFKGLQEREPDRKLYPFARRDDNDDIACFEKEDNTTVHIIHEFADAGWEQKSIQMNHGKWDINQDMNLENIRSAQQIEAFQGSNSLMNIIILSILDLNFPHLIWGAVNWAQKNR